MQQKLTAPQSVAQATLSEAHAIFGAGRLPTKHGLPRTHSSAVSVRAMRPGPLAPQSPPASVQLGHLNRSGKLPTLKSHTQSLAPKENGTSRAGGDL